MALIRLGILLRRHRPWDMVLVCYGFPSQVGAFFPCLCLHGAPTMLHMHLSGPLDICAEGCAAIRVGMAASARVDCSAGCGSHAAKAGALRPEGQGVHT